MAIKEEQRDEGPETKVENGPNSTDVNTRIGVTNDAFDLMQKHEIDKETEIHDDLYGAIKRGDQLRVNELTGQGPSADVSRPDPSGISALNVDTRGNAEEKDAEDKRRTFAAPPNGAPVGEDGQPLDPLAASMLDPLGIGAGRTAPPGANNQNDVEQAVADGDWNKVAQLRYAEAAREENERQDLDGDGRVASVDGYNGSGGGGGSSSSDPDEYGGYYDSYGDYYDSYGGHYDTTGYQSADGSYTANGTGERLNAQTNTITLQNGETYQPLDANATAADLHSSVAASADVHAMLHPGSAPAGQQIDAAAAAGTAGGALHTDSMTPAAQRDEAAAGDIAATTLRTSTGRQWNDPAVSAEAHRAQAQMGWELRQALNTKFGTGPAAETAKKQYMNEILQGDTATRDRDLHDLLGSRYDQNKDAYTSLIVGRNGHTGATMGNAVTLDANNDGYADYTQALAASTATSAAPATTTTGAGASAPSTLASTGWNDDGGYFDAWGYSDQYGGYAGYDGSYTDVKGNYVDKKGDLFLASNTSGVADYTATQGGPDYKALLQQAAIDGKDFTAPASAVRNADAPFSSVTVPAAGPAATTTTTGAPAGSAPINVSLNTGGATTGSLFAGNLANYAPANFTLSTDPIASLQSSNFFSQTALSSPSTGPSVWDTKYFDPGALKFSGLTDTSLNLAAAAPAATAATVKAPSAGAGMSG